MSVNFAPMICTLRRKWNGIGILSVGTTGMLTGLTANALHGEPRLPTISNDTFAAP